MIITKIKFKNHPILRDLELDLKNPHTGQPYNTVILAGENGLGKTTILSDLSSFLNKYSIGYISELRYIVDGSEYIALPPDSDQYLNNGYYKIISPDGSNTQIRSGKYNRSSETLNEEDKKNRRNIRNYGCVLSKARSDYNTNAIRSVTTSTIDVEPGNLDGNDDYTSLKQLLIDIDSQDHDYYYEVNLHRDGNPLSPTEFEPQSKGFRFKKAFNTFFNRLHYDRVKIENGEKIITFKKSSAEIPIDSLSTGEKQIVYRGAYLLRNVGKLDGGIVCIDEPELSMHPKWELNILKYYRDLFRDSLGEQKSQLFIATHSQYVVTEALKDTQECIVFVLTEQGGFITAQKISMPGRHGVLPTTTSAETNYLAFDIPTIDYHIQLYSALQSKVNKYGVKECDSYIESTTPHYDPVIHGKHSSHGTTQYETLPTYIRNAIDHPDNGNQFTAEELRVSTELLRTLLQQP